MSRWADFGFPEIALQPAARVYFGLLLALRERYRVCYHYESFENYYFVRPDLPQYLQHQGTGHNAAYTVDQICDGVFNQFVLRVGDRYRIASIDRCAELLGEPYFHPRNPFTLFYPEWHRPWAYQRYRMINLLELIPGREMYYDKDYFMIGDKIEVEDVHGQFEFYDKIR